jgi:ATP-dependent RNA helicase DeaD
MHNLTAFQDLGLTHKTLKALEIKGFKHPSPIQSKIIPIVLSGIKDIIGQAETGTGKTAAFALPIIEKISAGAHAPQILVLVPTRELAIQASEEFRTLCSQKDLKVLPIYGGQSIQVQLQALKKGVDIIVGTPGRLKDHLQRRSIKVDNISHVVLDEADEMLSMGFLEDVEFILEKTPKERRTLLFSATMSGEVLKLAKTYMNETEKVVAPKSEKKELLIDEVFYEIPFSNRFDGLCRILNTVEDFYGVIFCKTRLDVEEVSRKLQQQGFEAEGIHGDVLQKNREKIIHNFKNKKKNILVATDIAARGIDIQNLTHVINYALPQNTEAYVHRIGRTGRAGKKGIAITLITSQEFKKLDKIKRITNSKLRKESLPTPENVAQIKKEQIKKQMQTILKAENYDDYKRIAHELLEGHPPVEAVAALLKHAFGDLIRKESHLDVKESAFSNDHHSQREHPRRKRFDSNRGDRKSFGENRGGKKRFGENRGGKKRFGENRDDQKRFGENSGGKKRFGENRDDQKRDGENTGDQKRSGDNRSDKKRFEGKKFEGKKKEHKKRYR